jgi:hypothetical protein
MAMKSTMVRGAGNAERTGEIINAYSILMRKSNGRDHLGDLGIVEG